jgi:uncharacterized protein (DUF433 family)
MSLVKTNKKILAGKTVIKGTCISVEFILKLLSEGKTTEYILDQYPQLKKEDIFSAIDFARTVIERSKEAKRNFFSHNEMLRLFV